MESEIEVIVRLFVAVSERDVAGLLDCYAGDVSIRKDDALP